MTAAGRQHGQKKEGKREAGGTESSFHFPSTAEWTHICTSAIPPSPSLPVLRATVVIFKLAVVPFRSPNRPVSPILSCGVIDSLIEASRIQPPRCTALPPSLAFTEIALLSVRRKKTTAARPDSGGGAQSVGAVGRLRVRVQNSRAIGSKEQISAESF